MNVLQFIHLSGYFTVDNFICLDSFIIKLFRGRLHLATEIVAKEARVQRIHILLVGLDDVGPYTLVLMVEHIELGIHFRLLLLLFRTEQWLNFQLLFWSFDQLIDLRMNPILYFLLPFLVLSDYLQRHTVLSP